MRDGLRVFRKPRLGATAIVFQLASLTDVHWTMSGEVVLITLLGGMGTVFGPVAGLYRVPDDWHGSYIDQGRGGIVVAEVFRNADRHRMALARLLPPAARWESGNQRC